jgi:competence protein ComEA
MLNRFFVGACSLLAAINFAFAGVEANNADKAALDGIKEIGPKTAQAIIAERTKGGAFKDWDDLVKRIKGIGAGNAAKMSAAGLTVNGQSLPSAPAKAMGKGKAKDDTATANASTGVKAAESGGKPAAAETPKPTAKGPKTALPAASLSAKSKQGGAAAPASN